MLKNLKQFAITKEQQVTVFGGNTGGTGGTVGTGGNGGGDGGGNGGDLTDSCDPNVEIC